MKTAPSLIAIKLELPDYRSVCKFFCRIVQSMTNWGSGGLMTVVRVNPFLSSSVRVCVLFSLRPDRSAYASDYCSYCWCNGWHADVGVQGSLHISVSSGVLSSSVDCIKVKREISPCHIYLLCSSSFSNSMDSLLVDCLKRYDSKGMK